MRMPHALLFLQPLAALLPHGAAAVGGQRGSGLDEALHHADQLHQLGVRGAHCVWVQRRGPNLGAQLLRLRACTIL